MTIFKKLSHKFCNIAVLGITILHRTSRVWPDKIYIKLLYRLRTKGKLNLSNPSSFNEKLQWLKLYNRRPEYTIMVDKVKAKEYVASVIGDEYIIPTLGVWEHAEDIDFDSLPNKFVIKCNHNSGLGMYICRDKSKMNVEDVRNGLRKGLNENYFLHAREWPYKNVPRRIIAEQFMEDKEGEDLKDYKLFCFDGEVKFAKVDFDRFKDHHANYYSPSWSLLPFGEADYAPDFNRKIDKPEKWDQMLDFARKLSKDIPFARIDFYEVKGRTYFGEITFFPASGFGKWTTIESDNLIGKYLKLPNGGGVYN